MTLSDISVAVNGFHSITDQSLDVIPRAALSNTKPQLTIPGQFLDGRD